MKKKDLTPQQEYNRYIWKQQFVQNKYQEYVNILPPYEAMKEAIKDVEEHEKYGNSV